MHDVDSYFCEKCFTKNHLIQCIKSNGKKANKSTICGICKCNIKYNDFIIHVNKLVPVLEKAIHNIYEYNKNYSDDSHSYGNILDYRAGYIKSLDEVIDELFGFKDKQFLLSEFRKADPLFNDINIDSSNFRIVCAYGIDFNLVNWEDFSEHTKHKARYFEHESYNFSVTKALEKFKDFFDDMTINSEAKIYRARRIKSEKEITGKHLNTSDELGKAPTAYVKNNRFSPIGISYGYFAFDKDTALKEIRAQKHEKVAIGKFQLNKSIKLIDLKKTSIEKYLNPFLDTFDFKFYCTLDLIKIFTNNISKPIKEEDSQLEYVPTQIISEYIWSIGYDGFIFDSSQKESGENIVIFGENPSYINHTITKLSKLDIILNFIFRR